MSDIKIIYTNKSMKKNLSNIFVFTKNKIFSNEEIGNCIAWKVIENVGREFSCEFFFSHGYEICASWDEGACKTKAIPLNTGCKYVVRQDDTGVLLEPDGYTSNPSIVEVKNEIHMKDGICVEIYNNTGLIMADCEVGYDLKASFELQPVLFWGLACEIQEGELLSTAVLESDNFYEQSLEGVSHVGISLYGNDEEGYEFKVDCEA